MNIDRPDSQNSTTSSESDRLASTSFPEIKRLKKKYSDECATTDDSVSSVSSSSLESEDYEGDTEDTKSRLERKLQSYFPIHKQLVQVQPLLESIAAKAIFSHKAEMRAAWVEKTAQLAQLAQLKDAEVRVDSEGKITSVKTKDGVLSITRIIGSGNNGIAYETKDKNDKVFVLKAINMANSSISELTARTLRESSNMNKNNIESEVLFDKINEQLIVTMPFYEGKSVKNELSLLNDKISAAQEQGRSSEALLLTRNMFEIIVALLKEIDQFHTNTGLVHGDAWVDNFRVVKNAAGKYAVNLLDYGGCCESGITSDGYFARHLQKGVGNYHTAPELPNKANYISIVTEEFLKLKKDLQDKKQQMLHAKNSKERMAAKDAVKKLEKAMSKFEAFFSVQKIERKLKCTKFKLPENAIEKAILESDLRSKKSVMDGIEHGAPNIFKSYREYSAEINAKSDLHSIMASSIVEGMTTLFSDAWPVKSISDKNPENLQNVIADFMRWAMQYACNSDWFFCYLLKDEAPLPKSFIDEIVAKRDQEMAVNGWTVSNQARVDIATAIEVVEGFVARTESILQKTPQLSVAARIKEIQDRKTHI